MTTRMMASNKPQLDVRDLEPTKSEREVRAGGVWKTTNFLAADPLGPTQLHRGSGYNGLSMDDAAEGTLNLSRPDRQHLDGHLATEPLIALRLE